MPRFSSAVAISILGFAFTHGCTQQPADDDDDNPGATGTTSVVINTSSGGTSGNSSNGSGGSNSGSGGGSSGGGSSTSGGDGGPTFAEACPDEAEELGPQCGAEALNSSANAVNMLIVLDKSGSMDLDAGDQSRWAAMKQALASALTAVQDRMNFGLDLYPRLSLDTQTIDKDTCGQAGNCCSMPDHDEMSVPIGRGEEAVNLIIEKLDDTEPGGGTPTARALERALEYFENGHGSTLEGDKYVLLATDGGPNCNDLVTCDATLCTTNIDNPDAQCTFSQTNNCCEDSHEACVDSANVVDRIENLRDAGIGTFVVGIPGTENYSDYLNDFAEAGGQESGDDDYSYFRVDDVSELAGVFEEITIRLVTDCDITLPTVPQTAPTVVIDCDVIDRYEGDDNEIVNWEWEPGSDEITLTGDACERVQQGVGRIDVILGCREIF